MDEILTWIRQLSLPQVILGMYLLIAALFAIVAIVRVILYHEELTGYTPIQWIIFIIGIIVLSAIWIVAITLLSEHSPKKKEDEAKRLAKKNANDENTSQ